MRRLVLLLVAVALVATAALSRVPTAHGFGHVVWRDDFNGTSLDLSKWQPNWLGPNNTAITPPINGAEESCYDPSLVSVSGGFLHLRAEQRSCTDDHGHTWSYASGMVNSYSHYRFTYGSMRARVFFPGVPGGSVDDWPGFWADGTGQWPTTGEIDAVEGLDGHACYHFHYSGGGPGGCAAGGFGGSWHTISAVWHPNQINFWYDTKLVGHIDQGITGSPMYLILNLGISKTISPPEKVPAEMLVDWVEVKQ